MEWPWIAVMSTIGHLELVTPRVSSTSIPCRSWTQWRPPKYTKHKSRPEWAATSRKTQASTRMEAMESGPKYRQTLLIWTSQRGEPFLRKMATYLTALSHKLKLQFCRVDYWVATRLTPSSHRRLFSSAKPQIRLQAAVSILKTITRIRRIRCRFKYTVTSRMVDCPSDQSLAQKDKRL